MRGLITAERILLEGLESRTDEMPDEVFRAVPGCRARGLIVDDHYQRRSVVSSLGRDVLRWDAMARGLS